MEASCGVRALGRPSTREYWRVERMALNDLVQRGRLWAWHTLQSHCTAGTMATAPGQRRGLGPSGRARAAAEKSLLMLWRAALEAAGSAFFFFSAGPAASPAARTAVPVGQPSTPLDHHLCCLAVLPVHRRVLCARSRAQPVSCAPHWTAILMSSSACSARQSADERAFARGSLALLARLGRGCGRGALRARLPVVLLAALSIGLTIIILDEVACSARKNNVSGCNRSTHRTL